MVDEKILKKMVGKKLDELKIDIDDWYPVIYNLETMKIDDFIVATCDSMLIGTNEQINSDDFVIVDDDFTTLRHIAKESSKLSKVDKGNYRTKSEGVLLKTFILRLKYTDGESGKQEVSFWETDKGFAKYSADNKGIQMLFEDRKNKLDLDYDILLLDKSEVRVETVNESGDY